MSTATEPQLRNSDLRVNRARRKIAADTYETPAKINIAAERLPERCELLTEEKDCVCHMVATPHMGGCPIHGTDFKPGSAAEWSGKQPIPHVVVLLDDPRDYTGRQGQREENLDDVGDEYGVMQRSDRFEME